MESRHRFMGFTGVAVFLSCCRPEQGRKKEPLSASSAHDICPRRDPVERFLDQGGGRLGAPSENESVNPSGPKEAPFFGEMRHDLRFICGDSGREKAPNFIEFLKVTRVQ
jgi:hypothetical protein